LQFASCLAVLLYTARATLGASGRIALDHAFGLSLVAMLLVSPVTWPHYFLLLTLPLLLLWRDLPPSGWARNLYYAALFAIWLPPAMLWQRVLGLDMETLHDHPALPWQYLTVMSLNFYALLVFFVLSYRTTRATPGEPT
jgi:hypothetical protein